MQEMLSLDPAGFRPMILEVDGTTVACRAMENLAYVAHPVDPEHQTISLYVPEAYFQGEAIGPYTRTTAPIFLPNGVGGYMPGRPVVPGRDAWRGGANAAFEALRRGYVVASPGVRGRTSQDAEGRWVGKAPACIVDLKAAVRFLRANRDVLPGNTERIVSNGTSAGGALSALLGASGNHPAFEAALLAAGAARERDDVFAASCYCPITNLEHADMAYEWQFHGITEAHRHVFQLRDGQPGWVPVREELTPEQQAWSASLKTLFPAYLNGLGLQKSDGSALWLENDGRGSFADLVAEWVRISAQQVADAGADLSAHAFLTWKDGRIVSVDLAAFAAFQTRMKPPFAFDDPALGTPENELFGSASEPRRHFTEAARAVGGGKGGLADGDVIGCMNPMTFLHAGTGAVQAPFWRIRHGAVDRDTSLAIPVMLATRLGNLGLDVDLALPWGVAHAGDYDLGELFAWIDARVALAEGDC